MDQLTFPALSRRTLAASALGAGEPVTRALTPPIHVATTYIRDEDSNYSTGFVYGRSDNVSIHQAETFRYELFTVIPRGSRESSNPRRSSVLDPPLSRRFRGG